MYCTEWADYRGRANNLPPPPFPLTATVLAARVDEASKSIQTIPQTLTAIPYYAWANRSKGEVTVWFPARVADVKPLTRSELRAEQKR